MTGTDPAGRPLSVVVVNWNGAHLLGDCLESLQRQTLPATAYEIWVVDNASHDGSAELVTRSFPSVRLHRSPANLGFAGGCNQALRQITSPYAVLVNNDARAEPDFLAALLARISEPESADIGALTAKVLLAPRFRRAAGSEVGFRAADGHRYVEIPDSAGQSATGDGVDLLNSTGNEIRQDGFGQDRDWLAPDDPASPAPDDVFGFCGAGALLRMSAVGEAGFFDDRFFLYYEDTDLSWRLRLLGYRVVYEPAAVLRHRHAATTGEGSDIHRFYGDRNRLLCLLKNAPLGIALRAVGRFVLTTVSGLRRERPPWPRTRQRVRSLASFGRLTPAAVRARRRIGRTGRRSRPEVFGSAVAPDRSLSYRDRH